MSAQNLKPVIQINALFSGGGGLESATTKPLDEVTIPCGNEQSEL
jgi:hypothetical protein